jgi:hypothetical protein
MAEEGAEPEVEEAPRRIEAGDYVAPVMNRKAFHCPHCGVYATQHWHYLSYGRGNLTSHIHRGECFNCQGLTYWLYGSTVATTVEDLAAVMLYPLRSLSAPPPHPDFPEDPRRDYEEARSIVDRSPRGAVALLRLAVQKLCKSLGESGENINTDIASLVQKGLDPMVQQALDSLRVIGNHAVHPGQIDLRDDRDTAVSLFGLLNYIVEQQITRPKHLKAIYQSLPPSALAQIEKRDT